MLVSRLPARTSRTRPSSAEYECGFPAFEDSRAQFDVRFYLVAILFIVFDLEAAFLFPWAVSLIHQLDRLDRDDDLPRRARPRPRLRLEEGGARMGVMLRPGEDPMPTEEELARLAGLVPGEVDRKKLRGAAQRARREGLPGHHDRGPVHLGADRLAVVDDLRPRLLRGRDDPCEHAAL